MAQDNPPQDEQLEQVDRKLAEAEEAAEDMGGELGNFGDLTGPRYHESGDRRSQELDDQTITPPG
jgi:hypothetical protein